MSEAINKRKWFLFEKQAKGSDVNEIHVARENRGTDIHLKYNGKARRSGRLCSGEWVIDSKDKDAAKVDGEIREFLDRARKSFFVKREASLGGDGFKSVQEDEAAKAKPLVAPPAEAPAEAPRPAAKEEKPAPKAAPKEEKKAAPKEKEAKGKKR